MTVPPRLAQRHVYKPVGRCIYCGDAGDLTMEHIIPLSLGGNLELPDASCKACARITHDYEYTCARRVFGNFRMRHNVKTRRKKERPKTIPTMWEGLDGKLRIDDIPVAEHPAPLFTYVFNTAGLLLNAPASLNTFDWKPCVIQSDSEMQDFYKKYGPMRVEVKFVPDRFAQMIAKIGHSYAVAELGIASFDPMALDIILGREKNVGYLVGGNYHAEPGIPDAGHLLSLEFRPVAKGALIIVEVRLFASIVSPTYHVVVGLLHSPEHLRAMAEYRPNDNIVDRAVVFAQPIPSSIETG